MIRTDLRSKLFDTVLEAAVRDNFQQELDAIPNKAELAAAYSPSSELNQRIKQIISKSNHKLVLHRVGAVSRRAAVFAAILLPIAAAGLLSVEASRNMIFNAIWDWKSNHAELRYDEVTSAPPPQSMIQPEVFRPAYLPDGFTEKSSEQVGGTTVIEYRNKENVGIRLVQCPLSMAGTTGIDTEHSTYKEIVINGYKASLFAAKTPKDSAILVWQNRTTSFTLMSPIQADELILIATSILEN